MQRSEHLIDRRILEEAAAWMVQLKDSSAPEVDRIACERWCQRSPQHARAWTKAEALMQKFNGLPSSVAMATLDRPPHAGRRSAAIKLAALLAAVPASWLVWNEIEDKHAFADFRTAVGERREIQLMDGTRITLNTDTAIDVRFDVADRKVRLLRGEILVQTAPDNARKHRPFSVESLEGTLEALGTRFRVRQTNDRSYLDVLQGAVRIQPKHANSSVETIVEAGQKTSFTSSYIDPIVIADVNATAWVGGMLVADQMMLSDFAAELSRYRNGVIRVDPAIANVRISGAFPLDDTDKILTMLISTYPIEALMRLRGYWVTLVRR